MCSRMPDEKTKRLAWESALLHQECDSSPWVCSKHFESNQYIVESDGVIRLIPGAIPTLFDVLLIEVDEDFDHDNSSDELHIQNMNLKDEIEQLKSKLQSEKWFALSQIDSLKQGKLKQAKEIQSIRKEVTQLKIKLNKSHKLIAELKRRCLKQADKLVNGIFN